MFKIVFGIIAGTSIACSLAFIAFYGLGKVEFNQTHLKLSWATHTNNSEAIQVKTRTNDDECKDLKTKIPGNFAWPRTVFNKLCSKIASSKFEDAVLLQIGPKQKILS